MTFRMLLIMLIPPLGMVGDVSAALPRKMYPPMRERALLSERYDASEWAMRIMSDFRKVMLAFGKRTK